jgi:CheY-like chemotaxis protein
MKTPIILIVEDNLINTRLYQAYLNRFDVEFLVAENGLDGVDIVRNNSNIDIVLMNYMMPVMNGMEATLKIREFNKDIPIIMTSAAINSSNELKNESTKVGCNDYLQVPFRLTQFTFMIEKYLGFKLIKKI